MCKLTMTNRKLRRPQKTNRPLTLAAMLVSLLLGGSAALASEVKTQWTYKELWLHVKQVHPLADIAEAELDDFRAKLTHSERWWYPRMSANNILAGLPGEGSVLNDRTDFNNWGPYLRSDASLSVPLYTFGRVKALKAMARSGLSLGNAKRSIANETMRSQLDQAVLGLLYARELKGLLEDGQKELRRAKEILLEEEENDDESYDPTDKLRLKLVDLELRDQALEAESLEAQAMTGLRLLGQFPKDYTPNLSFSLADLIKLRVPDATECLTIAKDERPEVKQVLALQNLRNRELDLAQANFMPQLLIGGFARYSYAQVNDEIRDENSADTLNYLEGGAGLVLSWNFDWASLNRKVEESNAAVQKASAQTKALLLSLELEVEHAHASYTSAKARLRNAKRAEKASRGIMAAKLNLYEAGLGKFDPAASAVRSHFERRYQTIKNRFTMAQATLKLLRTIGRSDR